MIRVLALIVIVTGAWILWASQPINTAGNVAAWFIGDLEPTASADAETAFDSLCESERERIGEAEFLNTGGADYQVLGNFGVSGEDSQYPDHETLSGAITETWWDFDIQLQDNVETWRVHLVRERDWWEFKGDWKICGIEFRGEQPADQ